jgi:hypothetical protein
MKAWIMRIFGLVPEPDRCRFCGHLYKDCPFKRRIDEASR